MFQIKENYVKDYLKFDSLTDAQDYSDKMGYIYATSKNKSLNPSPIKINGVWCLEVTIWLIETPEKANWGIIVNTEEKETIELKEKECIVCLEKFLARYDWEKCCSGYCAREKYGE